MCCKSLFSYLDLVIVGPHQLYSCLFQTHLSNKCMYVCMYVPNGKQIASNWMVFYETEGDLVRLFRDYNLFSLVNSKRSLSFGSRWWKRLPFSGTKIVLDKSLQLFAANNHQNHFSKWKNWRKAGSWHFTLKTNEGVLNCRNSKP